MNYDSTSHDAVKPHVATVTAWPELCSSIFLSQIDTLFQAFFPKSKPNVSTCPLSTSDSYQSVSKNFTTIIYNSREHWYYINCSTILNILNSVFQFSYSLSILLGFKLNKPPVPNAAVGTDHLQHKIKEMKKWCVFVLKIKPSSLQQRNFIDYKPHCFKLNKMEI